MKTLHCISTESRNVYKLINFWKYWGASNKIATAGLPRAAEPWRSFRICQIDAN